MTARRVVVTGLGVIAPGGVGTKAFWERIVSGVSATRTITAFDATPFRSPQSLRILACAPHRSHLASGAAQLPLLRHGGTVCVAG